MKKKGDFKLLKMSYFKRFFGHLKTVLTHKRWVYYYAHRLGITWQGITHDLSKFSPVEFNESVKYWTGKRSPILVAKELNGISYAWLHHRGRNKHHYEYWIEKLDQGGVPHKIPFKYVLEMICDWCAACRTYTKNHNNIFKREYDWWKGNVNKVKMHEDTKKLISSILHELSDLSEDFQSDHYKDKRDELAMNTFVSWGYLDNLRKKYEQNGNS